MARFSDSESVKFGPWPFGSNNLAREDSLPPGHLKFAKNADVYPTGKVRERPGFELVDATAAGGDGLWSNPSESLLLYRHGTELRTYSPNAGSTLLFNGLHPFGNMVYCETDQVIYVSDSVNAWRVDPYALTVRPWGVKPPSGQPLCTARTEGGLEAGKVQVAITYSTSDGEESGAKLGAVTPIAANGGVALTQIPQPQSEQTHVAYINVYVTRPNGTQFLFFNRYPVGTTAVDIGNQHLGRALTSQFYTAMPAGHGAAYYNGTLYVLYHNMVIWSPPLWYGQWDTSFNYIEFGAPTDLVIAAGPKAGGGGVYVAEGRRTHFLPGETPKEFKNVDVGYGAMRGSGAHVLGDTFQIQGLPSYEMPVWVDKDGFFVIGMADGNLIRPTATRFSMAVGETASVFVRSLRGVNQYVVTYPGSGAASRAAFSDVAEMEPIRRAAPSC